VDDMTAASVVPYAEARSAIEAELLTAARSRAFDAWLEGRRKALAVIEPEFAHPGDPVHGIPSHRH
jgi:[acyl-carrier-protein] S-malonyltransferase